MKQGDLKFFWLMCFATVIVTLYWSVIFMLQQPGPLFIAFFLINVISLLINIICLIIDIRKRKKQ